MPATQHRAPAPGDDGPGAPGAQQRPQHWSHVQYRNRCLAHRPPSTSSCLCNVLWVFLRPQQS